MRSFAAIAIVVGSLLATPAFAAEMTIAVQAPEGLSIKMGTSNNGIRVSGAKSTKFKGGYYMATFNTQAPFFCAKVNTPDWKVVFNDGATTDQVCMMAGRLQQATIDGESVLVLRTNIQKI